MKAFLIDPVKQTIEQIEIEKGIQAMYKAMECDLFSAPITYENGDTLYCDDEGLFKPQKGGFIFPKWTYMIVGKALIMGTNRNTGDSQDVKSDIEVFRKNIIWKNEEQTKIYMGNYN